MTKIAYVFQRDAANPAVQSGRPASILRHLEAAGAELRPIFPLRARPSPIATAKKILYRLGGRYYRGDRDRGYLSALAAEAERRTRGEVFDLAFCPGSEAVSRLAMAAPIAFCADATFANMIDYYWDFSDLAPEYVRKGHRQEEEALRRAAFAIYPSEWAARSAREFYRADPRKVHVIPFGANFGAKNERSDVHRWVAERDLGTLRLLFVGKAWRRKGGDIAVACARELVARGFRVQLDLVSAEPTHPLRHMPWIVHHGLLDPNRPSTAALLGSLFRAAHFVVIPSRAEAYGMAFAEANAFGVPAVGTDTGGIPSIIRHGVNGFLLPLSAPPADYAGTIAAAVAQPESYRELCRRSFAEFEQRLNWRAFCARLLELVRPAGTAAAVPRPGVLSGQPLPS